MLVASGVSKRYGDEYAVKDVSLRLSPGELSVLVGRSGAGKTTLLRCLDGLEQPDAGTVTLDGQPAEPTDIAMIFQNDALIDSKSALANVLDGGLERVPAWRELLGWHSPSEKRAALTQLHDVGLSGYADRQVRALSGGQRQRVGIARALHQKPGALLADEPVASLDPTTARNVIEKLAAAVRDHGLVGIVSLHQPRLAESVADHYLGLSDGTVTLDAPADTVSRDRLAEVYAKKPEPDQRPDGTTDPAATTKGLDG